MSRMLDGLGDAARAAGDSAADTLTATVTIDALESRVRRGVRRRRQRLGALAAVALVVVGAGAVVAPRLLTDAPLPSGPIEPAGPELVRSDGALTVYADGTMSVLTDSGRIVDLPAPGPDAPPYVAPTSETLCAVDTAALEPGWVYASGEAQQLLGHGRPQYIDDAYSRQTLVQGQQLAPDRSNGFQPLAFELEAEPALASNIAFRAATVATWEGLAVGVLSQLDAGPATWTAGEGTAQETAVIQMRALAEHSYSHCADAAHLTDKHGQYLQRYLIVDVFAIDHSGSSTLLATHTSWTGTEFAQ
ncbi:hypothetical protein [Demequina activiva]|uniref:Uncharacterized protein n=1 Tax=Demequina activiva TaxID=1582364 RepID=A0A919Q2R7_9MICO|nr:hypothetical protein [Demequina activiva]GIG53811.1 hypothetical protein Dac01nite_05630 [Demequina activiva]